jgi:hypothetical protein
VGFWYDLLDTLYNNDPESAWENVKIRAAGVTRKCTSEARRLILPEMLIETETDVVVKRAPA